MKIIITSPSLNLNENVSGISAVTNFIIKLNPHHQYIHFEIGKKDKEKRNLLWLLNFVKLYFSWLLLMIKSDFDLIHFNFPIDKKSVIRDSPMILISKLLNKRMIIHVHGGEYLLKEDIPSWAKKILFKVFSGNNPKVFLSETEKDFAIKRYKCENVYVLANAVDTKEAKDFDRIYTKKQALKLLFLGRICVEKGLDYIFDALLKLKEDGIDFKFYMAGKGPEERYFVEKFQHTFQDKFIFKGIVFGENKVSLLKECNVFLLPSFFEGLPIALLEAMSFGLVPIATNVGSIEKVIKKDYNGLIIAKKSAEEIVNAIKTLYNNEALIQKFSINSKLSILNNYNAESFIIKLNCIYNYE